MHPYQPPAEVISAEQSLARSPRRIHRVWMMVYLYPVVLLGSIYGIWLLAWLLLGHKPRPNIDDPKSLGSVLAVLHLVPLLLAMAFPLMVPLGLVASFKILIRHEKAPTDRMWWFWPALYLFFSVGVYWLIRSDPLRVIAWYQD